MTGGGPLEQLTLPVNPEELQRSHPGRITTTQTLGGAYQDVNDLGVTQITLQGTTGWRGRAGTNMDGLQYAQHLYKYIFEEYYRRARVDPTKVELLLIDGIDDYLWKISIDDMEVFRNRSEPLLFRYSLTTTVLQNMNDPPQPGPDPVQQLIGNTTGNIQTAIGTGNGLNNKPLRTYKVVSGDTLWAIAAKYLPSGSSGSKIQNFLTLIAQTNHVPNANLIYPGQIFKIPWA